jgi:putative ABC transport system permease protein
MLRPEDEILEGEAMAVLSHSGWQRLFGSDPEVLGSRITLDRESFTVVGVLQADFRPIVGEPELWVPLRLSPESLQRRTNHFLLGIGRLRSGISIDQARADLETINARLVEQYPDLKTGDYANLVPLRETIVADARPALLLIMGAAALVLLIGCANVANLFLSRAISRRREMAVRAALGAGRGRIVRQLGIESLVLAFFGGAAGLVLAYVGVQSLLALEPGNLPRTEAISTSAPVLVFCMLVSVAASLLFGIAPALLASRANLTASLKEAGGATSQSGATRRSKDVLAVVQMAMAIVLLIGATLLVRSFERLLSVDPGFDSTNVLMARTYLDPSAYPEDGDAVLFHDELLSRLSLAPDVSGAAIASYPPLTGGGQWWLHISGRELEGDSPPVVSFLVASADYFDVVGSSLQTGRFFDGGDRPDSQRVVIINQAMAREYWPDADPIGERIRLGTAESSELEIVGVVSDMRQYAVDRDPYPAAFMPYTQMPVHRFAIVLDVNGDMTTATENLRNTVRSIDPGLALFSVMTLEDRLRVDFAGPRFAMLLAATFAFVALGIAAVGIYGVLSYVVSQRTHEIGVRLALGARPRQMVGLILRQGLVTAAIASAIGLTAAFWLAAGLESMLFEISTTDPMTFVLVPAVVLALALVACALPALRAAGLDPLRALRAE